MAKKKSGGAEWLRATGRRAVLLGITQEERELLAAAAKAEGRPLTQFVLYHAKEAAKKILKKI